MRNSVRVFGSTLVAAAALLAMGAPAYASDGMSDHGKKHKMVDVDKLVAASTATGGAGGAGGDGGLGINALSCISAVNILGEVQQGCSAGDGGAGGDGGEATATSTNTNSEG